MVPQRDFQLIRQVFHPGKQGRAGVFSGKGGQPAAAREFQHAFRRESAVHHAIPRNLIKHPQGAHDIDQLHLFNRHSFRLLFFLCFPGVNKSASDKRGSVPAAFDTGYIRSH